MSIIKSYNEIRNILNNNMADNIDIEITLQYLVNVLSAWLDTYDFDKEVDALFDLLECDYRFTGKLYRGITLLKDKSLEFDHNYSKPQSFSIDKEVAVSFATNNMITFNDEFCVTKSSTETIPFLIELDIMDSGINLFDFCLDLSKLCDNYLDEELAEDLKATLSYAIDEKEVLLLPRMFSNNTNSLKTYIL